MTDMHEYERPTDPNATKFRWLILESCSDDYSGFAINYGPGEKFKVIRDFFMESDAIDFIERYPERNFIHRWEAMGWTWREDAQGYFQ